MADEQMIVFYREQLEQGRTNLRHLLRQAAGYGGERAVPLHLKNELLQTRDFIQQQKTLLAEVGASYEIYGYEFNSEPSTSTSSLSRTPTVIDGARSVLSTPFLLTIRLTSVQTAVWESSFGEIKTTLGPVLPNIRDGRVLFSALCADPQAAQMLDRVQQYAKHEGLTIDYVLRFTTRAMELTSLPWELMQQRNQPLLLRGRAVDSLVRFIDLEQALPPTHKPNRLLQGLVITPRSGVNDELRPPLLTCMPPLEPLRSSGLLLVHQVGATSGEVASRAAVREAVDRLTPDVLHFRGTVRGGPQSALCFDTVGGNVDWVEAGRLMALLGGARLVVIDDAGLPGSEEQHSLARLAAALVDAGVTAVVAVHLAHHPSGASRFVRLLYEGLALGRSLQQSVALARQALYIEDDDDIWAFPTVTIRSRDNAPFFLGS